jgi:hypothetical protein
MVLGKLLYCFVYRQMHVDVIRCVRTSIDLGAVSSVVNGNSGGQEGKTFVFYFFFMLITLLLGYVVVTT